MKKILYVLLLLITVTACKNNNNGSFEVSGTIKNAPGKKVYLIETPLLSNQPVILDSGTLTTDGTFALKARATDEGVYRLSIENGPDVVLINDNDEIEVNLDVNNYKNYEISGSQASKNLRNLFNDYRKKDSAIFINFKIMDSLRSGNAGDSVLQQLQSENEKAITSLNQLVKNFIDKTESPAAALYAMGIGSQTMPVEELKPIVDAVAKRFPEHNGIAQLKSMFAIKAAPKNDPGQGNSNYALMNKQAPELTMPDVNGKMVSLSDFRGKYVLVDFWASWCAPCRQENPHVVDAYNRFKDKNFTILGVSLDGEKEDWLKAIKNDNLNWTHISDLKQWESSAVPAYNIDGIPFNVLLDPTGKIIASSLRGEQLSNTLAAVLK